VLGTRLRNARLASGLSQAEVAGNAVSTAYVSRIEAGQRRPDLKVLEQLAPRAGITLQELLHGGAADKAAELRVALDYAELSLRAGSAEDALERSSAVLDQLTDRELDLRRQAELIRALALEATGNVDDCIRLLEDVVGGEVKDVLWLRSAIALTRCYRETGDLARAIELGESAFGLLGELGIDAAPEGVQLVVTVAAAHFERGDVGHAVRLCQRAIDQAEHLDSPRALASAYWNTSVMESERGNVASAISLAERAIALLAHEDDNRNLARLHSQLGIFQLRLDPPDTESAYANLEQAARALEWSSASPTDKARNQLALARALFLKGQVDDADEQVAECYAIVRDTAPLLAADALVLQGQIAAERGDKSAAEALFTQAVAALTSVGADRHAAKLWFELGALLERLGAQGPALDAYRRGAVSTGLVQPSVERALT
jgi:transcriptional regulator with XRE-family HTH domain